jgi:16S rRNA (guanine(966)-N(2))-methyltransferase RsmD
MSRIIAGQGKARQLKNPKGLATRPTGARVRQTLFDILAPEIRGCRFLDVFAGSGGVGLEALSRGASTVVLVDQSSAAVAALRDNVRLLAGTGGFARVYQQDARVALAGQARSGETFDVIYLDPPYASDLYELLLEAVAVKGLLASGGTVVAEHFKKKALPERIGTLACTREAKVGDHRLSFYRQATAGVVE